MYVYSWFIVLRESLLTVRLAVSEIKPVQSLTDRQTDRLTDRQTDRNVNYSNSRCACARGLIKSVDLIDREHYNITMLTMPGVTADGIMVA